MIRNFRRFERALLVAGVLCATACSSSDDGAGADAAPPRNDGGSNETKPTYALMSLVFNQDSSSTYLNLFDTLDITSVDFAQAREFPGIAGIGAVDGKLFVSSGDGPTVARFDVTNHSNWTEEGRVSFANFGLATSPLYMNGFVSPQRSYMTFNSLDRVVWDPSALAIVGPQTASPDLPLNVGGKKATAAYSRGVAARDDRAFWPVYWADDKYVRFAPTSKIGVYDTTTDATRAVIEAPCPGLDFVTQDDDGNLYFSNWVFPVGAPLFFPGDPSTCMVRIKKGEEAIDSTFSLKFSDVTEGREAAAFHYLKNGKGFLAVFHKERITVTPDTDPSAAVNGNNWRFWSLDLNTRTAAPIEGIDFFSGGYTAVTHDGRTFVLLPSSDYSATTAYEILADGTAVKRFQSNGWAYDLVKVK